MAYIYETDRDGAGLGPADAAMRLQESHFYIGKLIYLFEKVGLLL